MTFSDRTNWNLAENDLASAVRARRAAGKDLVDLTISNPTECGFDYDPELLAPLYDPAALVYHPASLGVPAAREAVAGYYRDHGVPIDPSRIALTTSTSEAYSFLFRLLCDPGDEVLVARPSYPLFEYIARLDDVTLREYPLLYDPNADAAHGWAIDLHELEAAVGPKTRAVILVHPSNPTGNFVSLAERQSVETICAERGLALLVDEVFLDYALEPSTDPSPAGLPPGAIRPRSFAGDSACLTFVLSGLSKVCALPQMKLSWIAASGPERLAEHAMERLEVIADTFLSVNTPIQLALPYWLAQRHGIQYQIRERLRHNLTLLEQRLCAGGVAAGCLAQRLSMQGGWTAVLRVPRTVAGRGFADAALDRGVLLQPGEFYGLPAGRAVLSLLLPAGLWTEGLRRLPIDGAPGEFG